ncbi:MAG: AraC family transcriptional regulator ligand-binding domain-containing protein, partial [Pseudomonadota bacterium]
VGRASPGTETRDLVEALGLDPEGPIDPARLVPSKAYYDFFAALAERDPEGAALPLRIGAAMRSDDYGAFGLAWKSAPNLLGSYTRSERYGRVLGSAETYTVEPSADGVFLNLEKAGDGRVGMLLSNEASLSAVDTISREVSASEFTALGVFFKHSPRGSRTVFESHFNCPVHFEAGRDALLVSEKSLNTPNRLGDASIASFFDRHLEQELSSVAANLGLEVKVRRAVANMLSEGVPTLTSVAAELGLGARTLQRRLAREGHTFQETVDSARKDLAKRLLRETDYSLAEIAFLTGFAEQSAFTRAFKRWGGKTPRSYRISSRA